MLGYLLNVNIEVLVSYFLLCLCKGWLKNVALKQYDHLLFSLDFPFYALVFLRCSCCSICINIHSIISYNFKIFTTRELSVIYRLEVSAVSQAPVSDFVMTRESSSRTMTQCYTINYFRFALLRQQSQKVNFRYHPHIARYSKNNSCSVASLSHSFFMRMRVKNTVFARTTVCFYNAFLLKRIWVIVFVSPLTGF